MPVKRAFIQVLINHKSKPESMTNTNLWQSDKISKQKRKRNEASPTTNTEKRNKTSKTQYTVPVQNRYQILDDAVQDTPTKQIIRPKPEPIFGTDVKQIPELKFTLNNIINDDNKCTMTTLTIRSGHIVKVMPADIETYKLIRENFIKLNISHYTYQLKHERDFRVVLKGIHASEDIISIKEHINKLGHEVRNVVNIRHRITKDSLPLYFIDLESEQNNKDIYNVKKLDHSIVNSF